MQLARSILVARAAFLLVASGFHAVADEPDLADQMQHNRPLRLTGARRSETASQHLIATFVEANGSTNVITVSFATGRSTPTRGTVQNVILGAIDWATPRRMGLVDPWHLPKAEVIFSAPTNLVTGDFSGWFLVSLVLGKTNAPAASPTTNWPAQVNGTNVTKTFRFRPAKTEFRDRGTRRQSYVLVFKIEEPDIPAEYYMMTCWDTEADLIREAIAADDGYITVKASTVTGPVPRGEGPRAERFWVDGRVLQGWLQLKLPAGKSILGVQNL